MRSKSPRRDRDKGKAATLALKLQVHLLKTYRQNQRIAQTPALNHTWKQYGQHLNGKPIQEVLPNGAD